ncbi:cell wall hydrolase [Guptibacillus hwajinpoensis]|uniref:Cell wall hydrolase n=2 Tax=Guptibacillus hwajinpoensis TaxID=208199 RepID=A0A0J6CTV6_9BACL|nr:MULTISPECIES: cell wall hydrolase [Alkalihalobacillus]KMM36598.1 cell wall hydrolase [Alkalihalobacillus macyae]MDP4551494.1 cell wall hydrolase [Alkalihalobacillus macyae]MDQ0482270.1 N-acetylmuramoyl-L-alanine amidase [Alkalihalobacillus hemicentroti]
MAVIKANESDVTLLARLMRAEAEGDGQLGMLMVGNVGVNRVKVRCIDFKNINSMNSMVYQNPGGFEATQKGYFYQRAREKDKRLARKAIKGMKYDPASYSLWFFKPGGACPEQWFDQWNAGRFKSHCFYKPTESECSDVYNSF